MTREELLSFFDVQIRACKEIMRAKNQDYAEVNEVFGNLNVCEALELAKSEVGILIRMSDKFRRLSSLTRREGAVKDESFDDTCRDLINYIILLMARRWERQMAVRPSAPAVAPAPTPTKPFNPDNDKDIAWPSHPPAIPTLLQPKTPYDAAMVEALKKGPYSTWGSFGSSTNPPQT